MDSVSRKRVAQSRVGNAPKASQAQGDLFQQLSEPAQAAADLDVHFELLGAISVAIRGAKQRGMGRPEIVSRMNELLPDLERPITERQLNAWTSASKEYSEFPARFLAAFCAATDCDLPLRRLCQPIGMDLIDARERVAKRLGENLIEDGRLARERRQLKAALGE